MTTDLIREGRIYFSLFSTGHNVYRPVFCLSSSCLNAFPCGLIPSSLTKLPRLSSLPWPGILGAGGISRYCGSANTSLSCNLMAPFCPKPSRCLRDFPAPYPPRRPMTFPRPIVLCFRIPNHSPTTIRKQKPKLTGKPTINPILFGSLVCSGGA